MCVFDVLKAKNKLTEKLFMRFYSAYEMHKYGWNKNDDKELLK